MTTKQRQKATKLVHVRECEGWAANELAQAAGISPATLRKAENGETVRPYVWGKILKAINNMPNKTKTYDMEEIRESS